MITAKENGWPFLKQHVAQRDGMCLSKRVEVFGDDVAKDDCKDEWGNVLLPTDVSEMEFEHVKETIGGPKATDDEAHGVTACAHHHRLSNDWRIDSKKHRAQVRDHLTGIYPEVWLDA